MEAEATIRPARRNQVQKPNDRAIQAIMKTKTISRRSPRVWWAVLGLVTVSWLGGTLPAQVPVLTITVGSIELQPGATGQNFDLWIANTGDTDLLAKGMNLRIQLGNGTGDDGAPTLMGVAAVPGTPWEGQVITPVAPSVSDPQYWDVRLVCDPFDPSKYALLGAGSLTRLAQLSFDTAGVNAGSWSLRLAGMSTALGDPYTGGTDYWALEYGQVVPLVVNGQLTIVPEPEAWGLIVMGAAFGCALWHRRRARRAL